MSRLTAIDPEQATGRTQELFNAVKVKMGIVPETMRVLGNSPASLGAYLGFREGLSHSVLSGNLRELIALAVSNANGANYSSDRKMNAALHFAKEVFRSRGAVSDNAIKEVKAAGYNEGEIVDIIALVSLSVFEAIVKNLTTFATLA